MASKNVIHSVKHFIHTPAAVTVSGTRTRVTLVTVVANTALPVNSVDVKEGSKISAIYVEMWVEAASPLFTVLGCVVKVPGGSNPPNYAETLNLGTYNNKRNILETHQGLAPANGNIIPLFRQWIQIPKGKQRMALGEEIQVIISATGANVSHCGIAIYKEYQ